MKRGTVLVGVMAGLIAAAPGLAGAAPTSRTGPMGFEPIAGSASYADGVAQAWDAAAPWVVPDGFTQTLLSGEDESQCRGLDIYGGGLDDWHDMNSVNETGRQAGRYLYRTHEVRLSQPGSDPTYTDGGAVRCPRRVRRSAHDCHAYVTHELSSPLRLTRGGAYLRCSPARVPRRATFSSQRAVI